MSNKHIDKVSWAFLGLIAVAGSGSLALSSCGDDKESSGTGGSGGAATGGSDAAASGGSGGSTSDAAATGGSDAAATGGTGGTTSDAGGGTDTGTSAMTVNVPATITASTTWTASNVYVLPRDSKVAVKPGATLTIEAGTKITGQPGSALVITRGAKIMAVGTKDKPIVFTSAKPDGMKRAADWGGLIIMGKAPINVNKLSMPPMEEAVFEAYGAAEEDGKFGGSDPEDNSGTIKYVRIEFGGVAYLPDREWNNLTLCGVGRGTTVEYVQSHSGADDGVEFFGGTVNVKHLVLSQNEDDGLDTDNGWQGKAQFVVIQHIAPKGTDASNGYESDNHGTAASFTAEPRTLPNIYNVTSIGSKTYTNALTWGALFRRGTGGKYYNHIIMGFRAGVIRVRDVETKAQIDAGNLFVKNSIFFENGPDMMNWAAPTMAADQDVKATFTAMDWMNREVDPGVTDPYNATAPKFALKAGAAALTGAATPPATDTFFEAATFVGAVGTDDWTAGWTAYPAPAAQ
jgi:hypothetical protein